VAVPSDTSTGSISPSRMWPTREPGRRAPRRTGTASGSKKPRCANSTCWHFGRRSTEGSTHCNSISTAGSPNTTRCGLTRADGATTRRRCRPSSPPCRPLAREKMAAATPPPAPSSRPKSRAAAPPRSPQRRDKAGPRHRSMSAVRRNLDVALAWLRPAPPQHSGIRATHAYRDRLVDAGWLTPRAANRGPKRNPAPCASTTRRIQGRRAGQKRYGHVKNSTLSIVAPSHSGQERFEARGLSTKKKLLLPNILPTVYTITDA
jgi:hypothetical protein